MGGMGKPGELSKEGDMGGIGENLRTHFLVFYIMSCFKTT